MSLSCVVCHKSSSLLDSFIRGKVVVHKNCKKEFDSKILDAINKTSSVSVVAFDLGWLSDDEYYKIINRLLGE